MKMDRQAPSEQQPTWRRRPRIVDPALQLKYSIIIALFAAIISLFLVVFGIIVTHRVAGPLFVMNGYLKTLGEGQIPTTRPLRKKDELQEFYSSLLAVIE